MVYTLCFFENVPKHCLKRLKPKDLTITAVGTKTSKFITVPFRTTGCYVQVFMVEHSEEIILELKQRLAVHLKSRF